MRIVYFYQGSLKPFVELEPKTFEEMMEGAVKIVQQVTSCNGHESAPNKVELCNYTYGLIVKFTWDGDSKLVFSINRHGLHTASVYAEHETNLFASVEWGLLYASVRPHEYQRRAVRRETALVEDILF